jgi:hypothetical protein
MRLVKNLLTEPIISTRVDCMYKHKVTDLTYGRQLNTAWDVHTVILNQLKVL